MSKMCKSEIFWSILAAVYWFILGSIVFFMYQSAFEMPTLRVFLWTMVIVLVTWVLMFPVGIMLHKILCNLNGVRKNLGFFIGCAVALIGILDLAFYSLTFYRVAQASPLTNIQGILGFPLGLNLITALCMFVTPSLILITCLKGRKHDNT